MENNALLVSDRHLKKQWFFLRLFFIGTCFALWPSALWATAAGGTYAVTSAEYKYPAAVDPDVLESRPTELWAQVYRPVDLSEGPFPLIVFLHGNHATCGTGENPRVDDKAEYTYNGECPPGYVVTPNHLGYGYLAEPLASHGYIVVSINANRGINAARGVEGDWGLNLARGRLILKHLKLWHDWNTVGDAPASLGISSQGLVGKVDFDHVGLMGHSRGGEGCRAAYQQYRDSGSPWQTKIPGLLIKAIFEIAPVDGQTDRVLNADGAVWNVLLPMCDGDVSNLQGMRPFDRMLCFLEETPATPKSTYAVWGANHNFYNTEWQQTDSHSCLRHTPIFDPGQIGSKPQRQTAIDSLIPFFSSSLGRSPQADLNVIFNPLYKLPPEIEAVTPVDRGFTISPSQKLSALLEDFSKETGTSAHGFTNEAGNIKIVHGHVPEHDRSLRAGKIEWATNVQSYFQSNFAGPGVGYDIGQAYQTLDLRVSLQALEVVLPEKTDFSIQLVRADESLSDPVRLQNYTELRGPVGGPGGLHPILQTVRIPLNDFHSTLTAIRGVRFTFDQSLQGAVYLAGIELSQKDAVLGAMTTRLDVPEGGNIPENDEELEASNNDEPVVIELYSAVPFPVRNAMPMLRIGDQRIFSGGPVDADLHRMSFSVTTDQWKAFSEGAEVVLQYGDDSDRGPRWLFGPFIRKQLRMESIRYIHSN